MTPIPLRIKKLPLYTGALNVPDNRGLPLSLPFTLALNKDLSLIVKSYSKKHEEYLRKAYETGSLLSINLGQGSFGLRRAEDVLKYILSASKKLLLETSFLEIGCADGYLLHRLSLLGARDLVGVEPGPAAIEGKRKFKLNIINDFYKPGLFKRQFDVIFSYGVLEHVHDPQIFLKLQTQLLNEDGVIFAAVPNCTQKLKIGDINMLDHEHWSYFTTRSLQSMLFKSGLTDANVVIGKNQAMIYAWGRKSVSKQRVSHNYSHSEEKLFYEFSFKVKNAISSLQERITYLDKNKKILGLYGGGINVISVLQHKLEPRFFNTDTAQHGTYYPGYKNPIESPANLLNKKVDELWIIPIDYDEEIINYLRNDLRIPKSTHIFSLKQFLLQLTPSV